MEINTLIEIKDTFHSATPKLKNNFVLYYFDSFFVKNIQYIGIEKNGKDVYIQMKNENRYLYIDVSEEVRGMTASIIANPSGWWNENLRGVFRYASIGHLFIRPVTPKELVKEFTELQHHKATTIGLWCTDRPDMIIDNNKVLFELK